MIAAIYARKSTEQNGTADDQKSVARQIEHARDYAQRKGWTVADDHVYVDDGISGAEFSNRPAFLRLMNTLKPRAPFQALVMADESRLGREQIEVSYALKQLVTSGVRVFCYLNDTERTLDSPIEKAMLALATMADEMEREKARQRTYDAMVRKARAGHVTGGRVFGYDNADVLSVDGKRSHVERRINVAEAAIVLRIFTLSAQGVGQTSIAKTLNDEAAPSPRAQQGRPRAWAPSSVREVLHRTLYRGEITWNRTRKRNQWGQVNQKARKASEIVTVPAPHLRIVPDELWQQVHERLQQQRAAYLRCNDGNKGRLLGRPERGVESKYLLCGLARCAACGGSMYVKSRSHGKRRAFYYGCTSFHLKGKAVCANSVEVPMVDADSEVLATIEADILRADVIAETMRKALARLRPSAEAAEARRADIEKRLTTVTRELERLTAAIASGGDLSALVAAVRDRETQRERLSGEHAALNHTARQIDWRTVERDLQTRLKDWKGLLQRQVPQARQILKKLLTGPIRFTPYRTERERGYTFRVEATMDRVFTGVLGANMVASPICASWNQLDRWLRAVDTLRRAA